MSWEEDRKTSVSCPCGKGKLSVITYSDDWNRVEYSPLIIECPDCCKLYKPEKEFFPHPKPWYGGTTAYYLTPISYPDYDGIELAKVFPERADINAGPFYEFLIKNYLLSDLEAAKLEIIEKHAASKLTGIAKSIVKEYKTIKLSSVLPEVDRSISQYNNYPDNFYERAQVKDQEEKERLLYKQEKRKHQIKVDI